MHFNVRNIIVGWWRRFFCKMTPEEKKRYDICMACDDKEKIGSEWFCSRCWCACASKCRVKEERCLNGKW